jgi:hypothetical protein
MELDDLTTATPVEIDTRLADLATASAHADQKRTNAVDAAHRALGERPTQHGRWEKSWPTSTTEAIEACRKLADPNERYYNAPGYKAREAVKAYDDAVQLLGDIAARIWPYATEYARRPWPRFFTVRGGHVHSSENCQTCHRNGIPTDIGWNPELSGQSEVVAVKALGPMLCSVCFPSAPLDWTKGKDKPPRCEGSGRPPVKGTSTGGWRRTYGRCSVCPESADSYLITDSGVIRAHPPVKVPADTDWQAIGAAAYAVGEPNEPALNATVRAAIAWLPVGGGSAEIMAAFNRGWTAANLAAPVD